MFLNPTHIKVEEFGSWESLTEENGVRMMRNGDSKKSMVSEMIVVIYSDFVI